MQILSTIVFTVFVGALAHAKQHENIQGKPKNKSFYSIFTYSLIYIYIITYIYIEQGRQLRDNERSLSFTTPNNLRGNNNVAKYGTRLLLAQRKRSLVPCDAANETTCTCTPTGCLGCAVCE